MTRLANVLRIAPLTAAILIGAHAGAVSAPVFKPGLALQPKLETSAGFFIPVIAFPDAVAVLSTPPSIYTALQVERLPVPSSADRSREVKTAALTAPKKRPSGSSALAGKKSDVFDSVALPFKRLAALKRFVPVMKELSGGMTLRCNATGCSADKKDPATAVNVASQSPRDRMNLVNAAVNRSIEYRRDLDTYGVVDRWATPSETLSRGQGDCEDFAILKMAALASSGFELEDMSLVVIYDQKRRFYHAVLSVDVDGRNYILDNLSDQVLLDSQRPNYVALYSIKAGKGYLHGSRDKTKAVASATPLSDVAPGEGLSQVGG